MGLVQESERSGYIGADHGALHYIVYNSGHAASLRSSKLVKQVIRHLFTHHSPMVEINAWVQIYPHFGVCHLYFALQMYVTLMAERIASLSKGTWTCLPPNEEINVRKFRTLPPCVTRISAGQYHLQQDVTMTELA
jgi:hypothetical protein